MTRIFLKVYFFLLIPLLLFSLLPENPLRLIGYRLGEYNDHLEFGATCKLVDRHLGNSPQASWARQVAELSQHFAYALEIVDSDSLKLTAKDRQRLYQQGYIRENKAFPRLLYRLRDTDKILIVGMYPNDSEIELLEKQTRGMRYLVENAMQHSDDPLKTFNELKPLFAVPLQIKALSDYAPDSTIRQTLLKTGMMAGKPAGSDAQGYYVDPEYLYFLSQSREWVIIAGPLHTLQTFRQLFNYLYLIIPAVLVALGLLVWLLTMRREISRINHAAQQLGAGKLATRVRLPRLSTLQELADAFNRMATRIQKLVDGHRTLTNDISHELKTPIARLRFALEMQQEAQQPEEQAKYTQQLTANINTLESLINELLEYARLERREAGQTFPAQALDQWLQTELADFADYHPGLELQLELADSARQAIPFDARLLSRALHNLVENAARHTRSIVRVQAAIRAGRACLRIEDNGPGIAAGDREKVFDAFTRLDSSRQRQSGGYGLGLSIARRIAHVHRGELQCKAATLGGACFVLCWPVADEAVKTRT